MVFRATLHLEGNGWLMLGCVERGFRFRDTSEIHNAVLFVAVVLIFGGQGLQGGRWQEVPQVSLWTGET